MMFLFKAQSATIVKRLFSDFVKKHTKRILLTVALLLVIAGTTSLQPLLLQQAFDKIFKEKDLTYLTWLPVAIIVICAVQAVAAYFSNQLMTRFGNAMMADMRRTLFSKIINHEIEFYSTHDSGTLLYRVTSEIVSISNGIQLFFNSWVRQLVVSAGLIIVMFYQSAELSVIALSALGLAFYPIRKITRRLKKLVHQSNDVNAAFQSRLLESFHGIRVIKAFAKEKFEADKIGQYVTGIEAVTNKTLSISGLTPPIMQMLAGFAIAFVIWYGGFQVINGHMTEGNLIAFITSLLMVSRPIRSLTSAGNTMNSALVNAERFYKILDTSARHADKDGGIKIAVGDGAIAFEHVSFNYPNGTPALRDVSFTVNPGRKTALVGHSGSGKSTLFNLLLKFYDAGSGTIRIDGQDIATASINSVRGSIALVSQDIFIFDDSARNNIGYGKDGATEDEIIAAAKAAKCHDFIMDLPEGYDTKLGYGGQNLSGGQKQRISIARAFLRDSPILLLDEATSALDPKTESEIQESLRTLTLNRTTIVIAHRLSTVMNADKMILMDKGAIEATGTHEELLQRSPHYKDLFGI